MFPRISPIIPIRRRDLFENAEWIYELKHDASGPSLYLDEGRCRLISRRGNEMNRFHRFILMHSQGAEGYACSLGRGSLRA